jgi:hypothetical protein
LDAHSYCSAVLAALPTIVSSAIKRRLKGARARDGA